MKSVSVEAVGCEQLAQSRYAAAPGRRSNSRPLDRKSDTLPLRYHATLHKRDNQNLFKLIKTAYNTRVCLKLKLQTAAAESYAWSLERSPYGLLLTGGNRECRHRAGEYNCF